MYVLAVLLTCFVAMIAPPVALAIPAFLGLVHWLVAGGALGLLIRSVPTQPVRALAIATLAVSGVHLLFAFAAIAPRKLAPELPEVWNWPALATSLDALFYLGNPPRPYGRGPLPPLAGFFELARLVLWSFTIRSLAMTVKAKRMAFHPIILIIAAGGMTFILTLLHLIIGFGASYSAQRALWQGNQQGLQMIHGVYLVGLMITLIGILALLGGKCFIAFELWNRVWWKR